MKPVLIFDLDGTLVDSKKDLTASVNHVRRHFHLDDLTEQQVGAYIGDGAQMLVRRAIGSAFSDEEVDAAFQLFLSYYRAHMLNETRLYPGARETLEELAGRCHLAVLTNKPVRFSVSMLEGLGIHRLFAAIYGGNSFERKKPDPVGILKILEDTAGIREKAWMIGDSAIDVMTGRNAGISTCGVLWGYAADTFEDTPPDYTAHRFEELAGLAHFESGKA